MNVGVLLCLSAVVAACASNEVRTIDYRDEGDACLMLQGTPAGLETDAGPIAGASRLEAWVTLDSCASYCAEVRFARCEAALAGSTIRVTAEARTRQEIDPEGACPTACQVVSARCSVGPLEPGTYTLRYGEMRRTVEVPALGGAECGTDPWTNLGGTDSCRVERWAGPQQDRRVYSCSGDEGGPFVCSCDGRSFESGAERCQAALEQACEVDPAVHEDYCERDIGTCWPDEGDAGGPGYRCRCDGSEELVSRAEATCDRALFAVCSSACEDEHGRCEPKSEGFGYDCACDLRGAIEHRAVQCDDALSSACHVECEHDGGRCYKFWDEDVIERGFSCQCGDDGELTSLSYDSLGHDDCDRALVEHCDR